MRAVPADSLTRTAEGGCGKIVAAWLKQEPGMLAAWKRNRLSPKRP